MTKALIFGATSMLGRRLSQRLTEMGYEIKTAGRSAENDIICDLVSPVLPTKLDFRCDVLFHCAASFAGDSFHGALLNERINGIGMFYVWALASLSECSHVVNASSIFALNNTSYGISKRHGEDILSLLAHTHTHTERERERDESCYKYTFCPIDRRIWCL